MPFAKRTVQASAPKRIVTKSIKKPEKKDRIQTRTQYFDIPPICQEGKTLSFCTNDAAVAEIFRIMVFTMYAPLLSVLKLSCTDSLNKFKNAVKKFNNKNLLAEMMENKMSIEVLHSYAIQLACPDQRVFNGYKSFSDYVYGESNFNLIESFTNVLKLDKNDVFVDMGSGNGNVITQIAGCTKVNKAVGIEFGTIPAEVAVKQGNYFKMLMEHVGMKHRPFELHHGNFLDDRFLPLITKDATVIFINNLAFTPELMEDIFQKVYRVCRDGTRIIVSKEYTSIRNHDTIRNMDNVFAYTCDTIQLPIVENGVSWTHKGVQFSMHTIRRAKLEEKKAAHADKLAKWEALRKRKKRCVSNDDEPSVKRTRQDVRKVNEPKRKNLQAERKKTQVAIKNQKAAQLQADQNAELVRLAEIQRQQTNQVIAPSTAVQARPVTSKPKSSGAQSKKKQTPSKTVPKKTNSIPKVKPANKKKSTPKPTVSSHKPKPALKKPVSLKVKGSTGLNKK